MSGFRNFIMIMLHLLVTSRIDLPHSLPKQISKNGLPCMKIVGSFYVNPQAKLVHLETQNLLLAQSSHELMWDPLRKALLQGSTPHILPKQISKHDSPCMKIVVVTTLRPNYYT